MASIIEISNATEAEISKDELLTTEQLQRAYHTLQRLRDEIDNVNHSAEKGLQSVAAQADTDALRLAVNVLHRHSLWRAYPEQHPEAYEVSFFDMFEAVPA